MAPNDESVCKSMEYDANEPVHATHNGSVPASANGKGKQLKFKKTRRGWGSKGKKATTFTVFGNNANGAKAKKESLLNAMTNYVYYFRKQS